jgi:prepilin-type N-terminal cleavage/methylation domain-containing protein
MALRKTFTAKNRGFTLVEMLIVIGMIAMLGSVMLFIDLNSYRGDSFRAERSQVVTLLGQARIDALNNVSEEPHGLALYPADAPGSYVLFAGTSYAASAVSTRQPYKSAYKINIGAGSPSEVVFEQLSGNSNFSGTITLQDPNRDFSYDITLNHEGGISW